MQQIPTSLAKPGMRLAAPVKSAKGIMLMAQGAELTEAAIKRLRDLEIPQVEVEGEPVDLEDVPCGTSYAQRAERLDHLFRRHADNPGMMRLKRDLHAFFMARAAQQTHACND
jgi:hypothetical protein